MHATLQVPVGLQLSNLSEDFLLSRRSSNYSPKTIRFYTYTMDALIAWLDQVDGGLPTLDRSLS